MFDTPSPHNDSMSVGLNQNQDHSLSDSDESEFDSESTDEMVTSFSDLNLKDSLLKAISSMGWHTPTEVQKMCLAPAIQQRDILGFAQTGTGKTGVFLIAVIQHLLTQDLSSKKKSSHSSLFYPSVVVIAPTRELVMQIHEEYVKITTDLPLQANLIIGGVDMDAQVNKLKRHHDVIIATPGRLKDFMQKNVISLARVQMFVCDEVDRMFEIGFLSEVEYFLDKTHNSAQKLMFSATTNDTLDELTFEYLNQPKVLNITPDAITSESITQTAVLCSSENKLKVFIGLLRDHDPKRALIFVNTKINASWLHEMLTANGIESSLITGDLPQRKRTSLIRNIKAGRIRLLIATDVASRGLHIPLVSHVYNFDLPAVAANYIHRIGRTARAGAKGFSCSLVCDEYGSYLLPINDLLTSPIACEWFPTDYLQITLKQPSAQKRKSPQSPSHSQRSKKASSPAPSRSHLGKTKKRKSSKPQSTPHTTPHKKSTYKKPNNPPAMTQKSQAAQPDSSASSSTSVLAQWWHKWFKK